MKQRRPVIEGSGVVADMHHLRLMALLQELERDHGPQEGGRAAGGGPQDAGHRPRRGGAVEAHAGGVG